MRELLFESLIPLNGCKITHFFINMQKNSTFFYNTYLIHDLFGFLNHIIRHIVSFYVSYEIFFIKNQQP